MDTMTEKGLENDERGNKGQNSSWERESMFLYNQIYNCPVLKDKYNGAQEQKLKDAMNFLQYFKKRTLQQET